MVWVVEGEVEGRDVVSANYIEDVGVIRLRYVEEKKPTAGIFRSRVGKDTELAEGKVR